MLLSSNGIRSPATMFVDVSLLPVRGCPTSFQEETATSILSRHVELKYLAKPLEVYIPAGDDTYHSSSARFAR